MKKKLVLTLLLVFCVLLLVASILFRYKRLSEHSLNGKDLIPNTSIRVSEKRMKLGKVFKEDATATFYIYNSGPNNLLIEDVEVSCSCSSSNLDDKSIAPGDSVQVRLFYNKTIPGYFYSDVIIRGNFEKSPHTLSFEGYLIPGKKPSLFDKN